MISALLSLIFVPACSSCETPVTQQPATASAALRGFGAVTEESTPGRTVFSCEDTKHADILLGKLLADMFWNAGQARTSTPTSIGGKNVVVQEFQPYGAIIAFRAGKQVVVLGGTDAAQLRTKAAAEPLLQGDVQSTPADPYPAYLDACDLRNIRFHDSAMRTVNNAPLQSHWDFATKFGSGGIQHTDLGFWTSCPAPGVYDWSPNDYVFNQAKKNNSLVALEPQVGGILPLWYYNSDPLVRASSGPSSLLDAWNGGGPGSAGTIVESFGTTLQEKEQGPLEFLKQCVARYKSDPQLGAWMPLNGEPGGEFANSDRITEFFDYSPRGEEAFRSWLAHERGLSLSALGARWYGDENHFHDWSEVMLPDVNSFFGDPHASDSFNLGGVWQFQLVPAGTPPTSATSSPAPTADASKWIPFDSVPSQKASFLPHGRSYWRRQFDVSASQAGAAEFLVVDSYVHARTPIAVWLNGQLLGQATTMPYEPEALQHERFSLPTSRKLKTGQNELIIDVPASISATSEGKLLGPVFFTPKKPVQYPNLGAGGNARFVDMKDWQSYGFYALNRVTFDALRSLDPDTAAIVSGDDYYFLGDYEGQLCAEDGLGLENTGREAFYSPRASSHGVVDGFYETSEESATAGSAAILDRELGWMLFDGDASHVFYYRIDDNIKIEKDTGWFTKSANLLKLVGKAMREKPDVLLLLDPETGRLGFEDPPQNDIGTGLLEQMHIDNGYVTPWDIENGMADGYPVIFDCGTRVMDQKLLDAIQHYMDHGGTFVACADTGRNTPTEPDTWPISQLSGFRIRSMEEKGNIAFSANMPAAAALSGIKLPSGDSAGYSLQATAPTATPLATWDDGSTAIGYRPFGKGRMIVIGMHNFPKSGFSLNQPAPGGGVASERLEAVLLQGLGANRTSYSASPTIWTRRLVTKNGQQDWLVATNSTTTTATADVSMKTEVRPDTVTDVETGAKVEFNYSEDGWVHIHSVAFGPYGTKVFGMRRASLLDGLQVWWQEKTKYWSEKTRPAPLTFDSPTPGNLNITDWKFITDPDKHITADPATKQPQFDDSKWQAIKSGPWRALTPDLEQYKGPTVYRSNFTVPPGWQGHEVDLNFYTYDTPVVFGKAQFSIDGKDAANYSPTPGFGYSQTLNFDVTAMATPGNHVLTVTVDHLDAMDLVGGPFISGSIWFSASPKLLEPMDLAANWEAVGDDWLTVQPFSGPGRTQAKYLRRTVQIPDGWKGKTVILKMNSSVPFGAVVVNGTIIADNRSLQQFGTIEVLNLSPYLHSGDNSFELWPVKTARNRDDSKDALHADIQISKIQLGVVDPADLPVRQ